MLTNLQITFQAKHHLKHSKLPVINFQFSPHYVSSFNQQKATYNLVLYYLFLVML